MKILGVDPGLNITGYGLINCRTKGTVIIEAGIIRSKQKDLIQNRINTIYQGLNEVIGQHRPDVMVLEKLYTHHHHPTTACILGHVRGVICLVCAHRNIELVEHSVKRIRQSLTGKGAASKQQTKRMVARMLAVDKEKLTPDSADALALALGYAQISRCAI